MRQIVLGRGSIRTNHLGYNALVSFFSDCSYFFDEDVAVDFSKLSWFDANMSALLQAILHKLGNENRLKFFVDQAIISERFSVLVNNGFIKILDGSYKRGRTGSEIDLQYFAITDDQGFINYIENNLLSYKSLRISIPHKMKLVDSFLEIFGNVQKHADTEHPIFACGQYYPSKGKLSFTLVDLGIGYLEPIKKFTQGNICSYREAIRWAVQGNTSKKDAPGGLGLKFIINFCNQTGTEFEIISGNAYWSYGRNGGQLSAKEFRVREFCGTTVNIIFDANLAQRS